MESSIRQVEIYALKTMIKEIHINYNKKKFAKDLLIESKRHGIKGYITTKNFSKKNTSRGLIVYCRDKNCHKSFNEKKNGFGHYDKNHDKIKCNFFFKNK